VAAFRPRITRVLFALYSHRLKPVPPSCPTRLHTCRTPKSHHDSGAIPAIARIATSDRFTRFGSSRSELVFDWVSVRSINDNNLDGLIFRHQGAIFGPRFAAIMSKAGITLIRAMDGPVPPVRFQRSLLRARWGRWRNGDRIVKGARREYRFGHEKALRRRLHLQQRDRAS
jgi:hypothetical protein